MWQKINKTISKWKKALRETQTLRALAAVKFGHRPPARLLSQSHRQDQLQYTAPQLAIAQCNHRNSSKNVQWWTTISSLMGWNWMQWPTCRARMAEASVTDFFHRAKTWSRPPIFGPEHASKVVGPDPWSGRKLTSMDTFSLIHQD